MNSIYRKSEEQNNLIENTAKKALTNIAIPEIIDAFGQNSEIIEKCIVSVAVSFENATIDPQNQCIDIKNASIAFTLTPFTK